KLLELLEQRVVHGPIRVQDGAETPREVLLRPAEPVAETLTQGREKLHGLSEGRTKRVMTEPLTPSRGMGRPLSSRLTPPALPIVMTNGPFETHSRISLAGIVSSLVRPSSVRTRIHVVSVVRAMSRYGSLSPRAVVAAAMDADEAAGSAAAAGDAVAAPPARARAARRSWRSRRWAARRRSALRRISARRKRSRPPARTALRGRRHGRSVPERRSVPVHPVPRSGKASRAASRAASARLGERAWPWRVA